MSVFLSELQFSATFTINEHTYIEVQDRDRPGQPNWEYTMWKFQGFSSTHILHEINFGHSEAPKTAILTMLISSEFCVFGHFCHFQV